MNYLYEPSGDSVSHFMHLIQIAYCLFAAILLFLTSNHIKRNKIDEKKDYGLDLLAGALLIWVILSLIPLLPSIKASLFNPILSTFNNGLMLAPITFFEHGFKNAKLKFKILNEPNKWVNFVLMWSVVLSAVLICFQGSNIANIVDLVYSIFVLVVIGYGITSSFFKRGYGVYLIALGALFTIVNAYSQVLAFLNPKTVDRAIWINALIVWNGEKT